MEIVNQESLKEALATGTTVKFILGDNSIVFFSAAHQHRDIKSHGLSYEDDYRGNALAGSVTADRIEIHFHKSYSDNRIGTIWKRLSCSTLLSHERLKSVYYQGRNIT
jgi:hypothetical protein